MEARCSSSLQHANMGEWVNQEHWSAPESTLKDDGKGSEVLMTSGGGSRS